MELRYFVDEKDRDETEKELIKIGRELLEQKEITRKTIERNLELDAKLVEWVGLAEKMKSSLSNNVRTFGCQNPAEIEKDQWCYCLNCSICDSDEVLKEHETLVAKYSK